MDQGIGSRTLLKTATIASAASLAAILLLAVPASAEHTFDTDVRINVDRAEVAEGGRITLTIETLDGEPAPANIYVYLAIDGTATEGSAEDFTITDARGRSLAPVTVDLYDREVVIPQGSRSVNVRINTRNDSEAEQCEIVRVQGLQRDGSHKAFVGIFEYRITASDLGSEPPATLPSVDLTENGDTWTAALTDPGGVSGTVQWHWHRATRQNGPWTRIAYNTNRYTLTDEDAGYFLRAEARYDHPQDEPACAHVVWKEQGEIVNPDVSVDTSNNLGGTNNLGGNNFGGGNGGSGNGGSGNGGSGNGGSGDGGTNVGRDNPGNTGDGTNGTDPEETDGEESFTDLDTAGEHTRYVRILYGEGVFDGTGCSDDLLCPNGPLLRWEAAVWFVRVLDGKTTEPENVAPVRFTDVDANVWYAPYVERLAELGVTVGCSEDPDHYCPDNKVTRAQMATLLVRAFDLPEAEPVGFTDTDRTVHAPNIDASHAAGVTGSCSDEPLKFCPWEDNFRAEVATYLVRARAFAAAQ